MSPPTASPEAPPPEDDHAEANDVDLVLRHVTHRFPDELARALLPGATSLTNCSWHDTQVTARERRMDKSLYVVADGVPRIEHVEWQLRWTRRLLLRMFGHASKVAQTLEAWPDVRVQHAQHARPPRRRGRPRSASARHPRASASRAFEGASTPSISAPSRSCPSGHRRCG